MNPLTLDMYFTDFSTKEDRRKVYASELTQDIINNATKLVAIVNNFLNELGIEKVEVTSGWRAPTLNNKTKNAAKNSYHQNGMAVDLLDNKEQDLANLIASNPDLLRKYNLFLESPQATQGKNTNWTHLDIGIRADRPSRIFLP